LEKNPDAGGIVAFGKNGFAFGVANRLRNCCQAIQLADGQALKGVDVG
jgi:hypothetical protein